MVQANHSLGGLALLQCDEGYKLDGERHMICDESSTWQHLHSEAKCSGIVVSVKYSHADQFWVCIGSWIHVF